MRIVWTTPDDEEDTEIDGRGFVDPITGRVIWNEGVMVGTDCGEHFWNHVFLSQMSKHGIGAFAAAEFADAALAEWKKRWGGQ